MTEQKFDSKFHKWYVDGEGEVEEKPINLIGPVTEMREITVEEILLEYRKYIGDPNAELPEIVMEDLRKLGKV